MADRILIKPLTSIRFFAAMYVVIYHSGSQFAMVRSDVPQMVKTFQLNGYVGVTFFFVLSGFILHYTYRLRLSGLMQLRSFAIARVARIYPVFLLAVFAMAPFTPIFSGWRDVPQFFGLQWWITSPVPYFGNWNGPAWTVSVEMFFYICFPWLSAGAVRLSSRWILVVLVGIAAITLVLQTPSFLSTHPARFEWLRWVPTPILRIPEFIAGVLVCEWYFRRGGGRLPIPAWVPALLLIAVLCLSNDPWVGTAVTILTAGLIVAIAADPYSLLARLLQARWLVLLGAASYSLYLLQQPVHFAVAAVVGGRKVMLLFQYPAMLAASVIVFLAYEEPARERIRRWLQLKPSVIEAVAGDQEKHAG